jgi:hypothetical protein
MSALCLAIVTSAGCGRRDFTTEGDALRARVLDLEQENERLAGRARELEVELDRARAVPGMPSAVVRAAIPHVVDLAIGRLSHLADDDGDGLVDSAVIYLHPTDGRNRFVQLAGELSVTVTWVPPAADAETVGRRTLDPASLRDAYRSGFAGTHYTVVCPVDRRHAGSDGLVFVRADYADGRTGRVVTAEGTIRTASAPGE